MGDNTFMDRLGRRAGVVVPIAVVLFVVGVAVGVIGVSSASSADDDLVAAEAALEDARGEVDGAEAAAQEAEATLEEATAQAAGTLEAADQIAASGADLCDCDQQLSDLTEEARQALLAGDGDAFNTVNASLRDWAEQANTMDDQIEAVLDLVVVVGG